MTTRVTKCLLSVVAVLECGLMLSGTVRAEEEAITELPQRVVTAGRRDMTLGETSDIVRVIDREEINRVLPASLGELIEYANGVTVETGTGSGLPDRSVVGINGLPPSYTLVLINGVKLLSEHIHTGQNVDAIPPSAVERIEIMRGAASAQYGSDAIGGIVNIITRKYEGRPEAGVNLSVGSDNTCEAGAHLLLPLGPNAGLATFINWERSDGIDVKKPAHRVDNMGYERFNWLNRVDASLGDHTQIYGWVNWVENTMDWRGDTTDSTLVNPVAGIVQALTPSLNLSAEVAYSEWDAELSEERNRLLEPEVYATWRACESHTLLFGGEYRENRFSRTAVVAPNQSAHGLYVQDEWTLGSMFSLTTALRYDKVEDQQDAISPKAALLLSPVEHFRVRASVGRGYHAPTLQELYEEGYGHGGTAYRFGNPDLDPEYSTTYTLGFETEPVHMLEFLLYGFYSDIDDMIVPVYEGPWDEDPDINVWRRQNIEAATVYGAEANVIAHLGDRVRIDCGYTYTENESKETGRKLPYSPGSSVQAKVVLVQPLPKRMQLSFFVGARAVFDREAWNWQPASGTATDDPNGLTTPLDDYTKLDAGATLSIGDGWALFVRAYNLLGEDIENLDDAYTVIDGKPLYRVGLKYLFAPARKDAS